MADYGQPYYGDDAYNSIFNAANLGSQQAQFYGNEAAKVADPYGYRRRNRASKAFDNLLENPGQINSSPVYKYLMDQQMNAVKAKNAAMGLNNSGRGMLALQKSARDASSEAFFPLLSAYGKASGAFNPLSPYAASMAMKGSDRSMDYDQMAAAAKAAGNSPGPSTGLPWWMQGTSSFGSGSSGSTGMPSGGYYTPGQLTGAGYPSGGSSYVPSSGAGTGYVSSDGGVTTFGNFAGATPGFYPSYGGATDYTDFGGGDFGYSDYGGDGGYSDFGYSDYGGDY